MSTVFTIRLFGAGSKNRTRDLRITSALLYLLSYAGAARNICISIAYGKTFDSPSNTKFL